MSNITRRSFLQKGTAAAAALTIVPNTVLGKSHGHTAPTDKLNIAGIGIGGMGAANLRNMETRPRTVRVSISGLNNAQMWASDSDRSAASSSIEARLGANSVTKLRIFIAAPGTGAERQDFTIATETVDQRANEKPESDQDIVAFERPKGP